MPKSFKKFIEWCDDNRGKMAMGFLAVIFLIGFGFTLAS